MQKLGKREEQIMQVIWRLESAFIKEIIEEMPEPKPHYNTIATMVKILTEKGFLSAEKLGNSYRYTPLVALADYRKQDVASIKRKYFGNSFSKMITHFAREEKLSDSELDEIIQIIKSQKSS
ncbi:BlaI/MecI/CopY family transcriptional regulator [Pontibacter toksunensis]|uniref:BlaI/MecI/CopY family transcriptional regulator n=1 Tax=Pontibacter toksunensis TaxID=1332631 RepID=A0ABW6BVI4_9BACT